MLENKQISEQSEIKREYQQVKAWSMNYSFYLRGLVERITYSTSHSNN